MAITWLKNPFAPIPIPVVLPRTATEIRIGTKVQKYAVYLKENLSAQLYNMNVEVQALESDQPTFESLLLPFVSSMTGQIKWTSISSYINEKYQEL